MTHAFTLNKVVNSSPGDIEDEYSPGLELPPGSYVVFARVTVETPAQTALHLRMTIGSPDPAPPGAEDTVTILAEDTHLFATASLTLWGEIRALDTVHLFARGDGIVGNFRVVAIQVDALFSAEFFEDEATIGY